MKSVTIKIMALLLAALLVLPMLAACGDTQEGTEDTTVGGSVTEGETEKQPAVAKKDYDDAEFVALYCSDTFNMATSSSTKKIASPVTTWTIRSMSAPLTWRNIWA